MVEKLAIRSDRISDWRKKKVNRMKGDLAPRKAEDLKSSWAHTLEDSSDLPALLACRPNACRELQALALFIFKERSDSTKNVRYNIEGVSIHRTAFDASDIIEDTADHPIDGYQETHRSLRTRDEVKLNASAARIIEQELFECWEYDIAELSVKLRALVRQGEIREEYRPAAEQLLERWTRA